MEDYLKDINGDHENMVLIQIEITEIGEYRELSKRHTSII